MYMYIYILILDHQLQIELYLDNQPNELDINTHILIT